MSGVGGSEPRSASGSLAAGLLLPFPELVFSPYRRALVELGQRRPEVVVLGADLGNSTEIDGFRDSFPERFFNLGAAEQNEVGIAAGLALAGLTPFVHSFGVFVTRRPYEQVCVQLAMEQSNVKLVGTLPGLSSRLGPTHQAIDDLALMRTLPHMTVIDPADATEIEQLPEAAAAWPGPVYLRMMRREVPRLLDPLRHRLRIGRAVTLRPGGDLTLLTTGMMLGPTLGAAEKLAQAGIVAGVLHVATIKPLDAPAVIAAAERSNRLVTVENHLVTGGLGSAVAELLAEERPTPLLRLGLRDTFATPGSPEYLLRAHGLDAAGIAGAAKAFLFRWPR